MANTITETEYKVLRAKIDAYNDAASDSFLTRNVLGDDVFLPPLPTNEERSAVEVYEFVANPPENYFGYIKEVNGRAKEMITWTGECIGDVSAGMPYRDNFGGTRVPITVRGINGREYYGTYYPSSGTYCRIKAKKVKNG